MPFVLRTLSHGRMIITAANAVARAKGITPEMALADARAILPALQVAQAPGHLVHPLYPKPGRRQMISSTPD